MRLSGPNLSCCSHQSPRSGRRGYPPPKLSRLWQAGFVSSSYATLHSPGAPAAFPNCSHMRRSKYTEDFCDLRYDLTEASVLECLEPSFHRLGTDTEQAPQPSTVQTVRRVQWPPPSLYQTSSYLHHVDH